MSHLGNIHRNPRRLAKEIGAQRAEAAEAAAKDVGAVTPEHTAWLGWHRLTIGCGKCRQGRAFMSSPVPPRLFNTPWREVARYFVCRRCGTPTNHITFGRAGPMGESEKMAVLVIGDSHLSGSG